jgi:cytosine/adenosine deaminase-related metal-dependent hydrolase
VVTLDPGIGQLESAEILVEGDAITAIGPELGVSDAEVIEAPRSIAIPGFVDTHRHTWQAVIRGIAADWVHGHYMTGIHNGLSQHFQPEDTYTGNLLGTLEALNSGITTLVDWSHNLATPDHADAAVQALFDSGSRAVFAHGGGAPQWRDPPSAVPHPDDARRVRDTYFAGDDRLVTMAMALRGPQFTTKQVSLDDFGLARDLALRITVHVGDGEWGRSRPIEWCRDNDLLGADITYVHCNTLADDELAMIADSGGSASVAAPLELSMGHGYPATGRLLSVGIRPSLSIDVCTMVGGDMFSAMRATLMDDRARRHHLAAEQGRTVETLTPSTLDALEFATIEGARATGLGDRIGTLTPGKKADIVLVSTDDPGMFPVNNPVGTLVYAGHPGVVDTVLVGGQVVKRAGELVGHDMTVLRARAEASRDRLFERTRLDPTLGNAHPGGDWFPSAMQVRVE